MDDISNIKYIQKSFSRFNWKLYLSLLFTAIIPTIYTTIRINYLGNLPNDWGFNIASQLSWINLMLEVLIETIILPLFYCIGYTINDKIKTLNRVKTGLLITFLTHLAFSVIIIVFAVPLTQLMAQNPDTVSSTASYIRIEMFGITLFSLVRFLIIVFILLNKKIHIYIILLIQMSLSILLDTFFLSNFDFSLQLGVNGIAYSNAITSIITIIYSLIAFSKEMDINFSQWLSQYNFIWIKEWWHIGKFSGLDSLIRNLFYMVFIVRMMNVIEEQGTYWVANGFIWSWLLLPIFPLSDLLKQDTSTSNLLSHKEKTYAYFSIATIITITWILTLPYWDRFIANILNATPVDVILDLLIILLPFYILFTYNTLMDSIFYGKGKTELLAIQSIITNFSVYGVAFILFQFNIFIPSLISIATLFGTGIAVDSVITFVLYRRLLILSNGRI